MTSIPASRSALAMIFAPRSCPSSPGFAITTRILPATTGQYMNVRVTVIGSSPAWPNPGGAQSGYLVEGPGRLLLDCGPGVLARLRERDGWPQIDAIAITHFHLDHWGDLVPWVWGRMFGLGRDHEPPQLWVPPGGTEELVAFERKMGVPQMWERTFDLREYADGEGFSAGGLTVTARALPHYGMLNFGLRVERDGCVLAYSGDSAPSEALVALARD